jgi:hypothetical protein
MSAAGVIEAVVKADGDLGMFALDGGPGVGAWWMRLVNPSAPKVIARLPFVERTDHPAGMAVFVIARPLADGGARQVVLEAVTLDRWRGDYPAALAEIGAEIIGNAANGMGLSLLIARPGEVAADSACNALAKAGAADAHTAEVGAHADRFNASDFQSHSA